MSVPYSGTHIQCGGTVSPLSCLGLHPWCQRHHYLETRPLELSNIPNEHPLPNCHFQHWPFLMHEHTTSICQLRLLSPSMAQLQQSMIRGTHHPTCYRHMACIQPYPLLTPPFPLVPTLWPHGLVNTFCHLFAMPHGMPRPDQARQSSQTRCITSSYINC